MTGHHPCPDGRSHHKGRGPSSFWLHDPKQVFGHIGLGEGMTFVDAGCGPGEYSLYASRLVGAKGKVIALEAGEGFVTGLAREAASQGLSNIIGRVCDITEPLPLESRSADMIFLSTVLHIKDVNAKAGPMFQEFHRVLRPAGRLAVIDCKKEDANFGPPKHMRLSEQEVEAMLLPCGFHKVSELDLGHNYLLCFKPRRLEGPGRD